MLDLPSVSAGLSECISTWKISGGTCPMVDLALSSMALAVYSRTQQHPPAALEASSKYICLLRVAQRQIAQVGISTLNERDIDACLLAVFLMGRYEGTTYRPGSNPREPFSLLPIWSHHNGAMAILKVWYDSPSHIPATVIVKQTRRGLIRSYLLRTLPLSDWILDGSCFGERGLELDYDRVFVRAVNLHYASANLQKNDLLIKKTEELSNEAQALDKAVQDWVTQFPVTWSYQRHVLVDRDHWPRKNFYSSTVYIYSRPGNAAVWNQYFTMRMLINSIHLRILEMNHPGLTTYSTYEQQRQEYNTQLKAMAENLASSIPFCLERFKTVNNPNPTAGQTSIALNTDEEIKPYLAVLAIWPLTVASSLKGIDTTQRLWFKSQLARLGRATGEGVLECTETDHWATL